MQVLVRETLSILKSCINEERIATAAVNAGLVLFLPILLNEGFSCRTYPTHRAFTGGEHA
jgi:hypothetical protein